MRSPQAKPWLLPLVVLLAAGCGGDSSNETGTLNLHVTDAPVDGAEHVYVQFRGIELQGPEGRSTHYYCREAGTGNTLVSPNACSEYAPKQIDLLALSNGDAASLLNGLTLPAGRYPWVRLLVDVANERDSYIVISGAEHELRIPSGEERGLQLNRGFVVPAGGTADVTIDFDLRKSVHDPEGTPEYILRPTLRLVDNAQVGAIAGTVDASLVVAGCTPAVYVYGGSGVAPDDIDGTAPEPVTTARVALDSSSGEYRYRAGFLEAGAYTVAFTCQAAADAPGTSENSAFSAPAGVTVAARTTTTHGF